MKGDSRSALSLDFQQRAVAAEAGAEGRHPPESARGRFAKRRFEDEVDACADAILEHLHGSAAIVPAVWPLEVASVLVVGERRRRLTESDSARFMEILAVLPIVVWDVPLSRVAGSVIALAREHDLSAYDAAYLDLAIREGAPLASRDAALRRAASAVGVPLFDPGPSGA